MRRVLLATAMAGSLSLGVAAPAFAAGTPGNPSPTGTGKPSQDCTQAAASQRPGNTPTSPGSVFDEQGINSGPGGTGGNAYNTAGAPSQYDVACYKSASALSNGG
jgi:hypothetical protein